MSERLKPAGTPRAMGEMKGAAFLICVIEYAHQTLHDAFMNATPYHPVPIATGHIQLAPDLVQLTERLAENAHDLWAAQRLADGWTYGEHRDDKARKHPCLVPYAELSESEKKYDRETAIGTLRAILALGYRIVPPNTEPLS